MSSKLSELSAWISELSRSDAHTASKPGIPLTAKATGPYPSVGGEALRSRDWCPRFRIHSLGTPQFFRFSRISLLSRGANHLAA
mmetsp:Transcript_13828/g.21577  ORF Transcript_13828/g.21577 Transcript_13828/m.21577 type:complete len:84 (+) Transcript_13828:13-264(+)